jgi:diguanylate cyclase
MKSSAVDELDFEYAAFVGQRAVALMGQLKIPQTPANYAIWFNYCQGVSPGLKRAIDDLFETHAEFDASTSAALIAKFGKGDEVAGLSSEVSQRMGSLMQNAQHLLQTAITDNRNQLQVVSEIGVNADPAEVIECLVAELSKSVSRATRLEQNFVEASQELEEIKVSLDNAETRARTDGLTGLSNRVALEEFFGQARTSSAETGRPLSMLLLDVDHFKRFNDHYGHGVGDEVLRLIAKLLRDRIGDKGLPVRYGGEELMAVLRDHDVRQAAAFGDAIRRSISECKITRRSTGEILQNITVSIGVAQWQPRDSMTDLIERCDRALYRAKHAGRNQVMTDIEDDFHVGRSAAAASG